MSKRFRKRLSSLQVIARIAIVAMVLLGGTIVFAVTRGPSCPISELDGINIDWQQVPDQSSIYRQYETNGGIQYLEVFSNGHVNQYSGPLASSVVIQTDSFNLESGTATKTYFNNTAGGLRFRWGPIYLQKCGSRVFFADQYAKDEN